MLLVSKMAIPRNGVLMLSTFLKRATSIGSDYTGCLYFSSQGPSSSTGQDKLRFSETRAFAGDISGMPIYRQAMKSRNLGDLEWPESIGWPKKLFIFASLTIFVIYFWNREPNDLDEILDQPLWKSVPSYERDLLMEKIVLAKAKGESEEKILDIEKRIDEIDSKVNALKKATEKR